MDLVKEAYFQLHNKELTEYSYSLKYSRKFKSYNANVRISRNHLAFTLSSKWKEVGPEIQIGLIQSLLVKVFKRPAKSINLDLYHNFIKNLGNFIPTISVDPLLRESFERVNKDYFYNTIDLPNLIFGKQTRKTLGSYNFHTNTITISPLLRDASQKAIDYIMYHELLHKKMQFKTSRLRTTYHSKTFRAKEREFDGCKETEREIGRLIPRRRFRLW